MSTQSEAELNPDAVSAGTSQVTLVIPGRNCASTLERCLDSVVPLKESGQLREIIFVNDGSTDETAEIAARYPVQVIQGAGQGPGAARNLGWKSAESDLIWFIDSDCVAEPDALEILIPRMKEPEIAGVGGSYANLFPDSMVASLIHEEIVARHRRMKSEVDFLATFNVLYRRRALEETGGFNEELKLAQDAELAYRMRAAGHRMGFEIESCVGHHHPRNFWRYLRTQARQGYYRVQLYRQHATKISGDSYAGILDYLQPPLGVLACASLVATPWAVGRMAALALVVLLLVLQLPMTCKLVAHKNMQMFHFVWFGFIRAIARGLGLTRGARKLAFEVLLLKRKYSAAAPASASATERGLHQ